MVMFYALVRKLNHEFEDEHIDDMAARASEFEPGRTLNLNFLIHDDKLKNAAVEYVRDMPGAIREGIRAVIYQALTATPPRSIVFAWAPAYDYELNVWDAPCGITLFYKSRYPADARPTAGELHASSA
jgi:hypothetical protein